VWWRVCRKQYRALRTDAPFGGHQQRHQTPSCRCLLLRIISALSLRSFSITSCIMAPQRLRISLSGIGSEYRRASDDARRRGGTA